MTFKNPDTLTQKGHAEVGQSRESKPVKIYYEIHGNGPQLVMLVMGKRLITFTPTFSHIFHLQDLP